MFYIPALPYFLLTDSCGEFLGKKFKVFIAGQSQCAKDNNELLLELSSLMVI